MARNTTASGYNQTKGTRTNITKQGIGNMVLAENKARISLSYTTASGAAEHQAKRGVSQHGPLKEAAAALLAPR